MLSLRPQGGQSSRRESLAEAERWYTRALAFQERLFGRRHQVKPLRPPPPGEASSAAATRFRHTHTHMSLVISRRHQVPPRRTMKRYGHEKLREASSASW